MNREHLADTTRLAGPQATRRPGTRETHPPCAWCRGRIPATKRRDAKTCSKRCRQALHRFRITAAGRDDSSPMHFGYADPPYPGLARRYYGMPEVDHQQLIRRLVREFPDGWALSTSARSTRDVWSLCPEGTRLCIWVRGSRKGVSIGSRNAWEALFVWGGRARRIEADEDLDDVLVWGGRQHSHPDALVGMKPAAFCEWMFRQLGALGQDHLADLFPGSGAVSRAWEMYTSGSTTTTLPSRLQEAQIRLGPTVDGSCGDDKDTSRAPGRDVSCPTGSARQVARYDASCGYLRDACNLSQVDPEDISPSGPHDPSCGSIRDRSEVARYDGFPGPSRRIAGSGIAQEAQP